MNMISEEKINEIRDAASIVDIISSYIPLTKKGKNYFGVCPFHDDHSPSMSVSSDREMFKCFTCGVGGNVFTFVSKYENISFIEAVKKVADATGIDLNISGIKNTEKKYQYEYEIMDFATKIYQNNLNSSIGKTAKEYLKSREISDSVINTFKIGFATNNNKNLYNLLSKKYKNKDLEALGLINVSGIDGYDKFVNRIMIPITNEFNDIVGFTGRIIDKNSSDAKYINTKETVIYKKGNILFNYFNAKEYIKSEKSVIIVEGNMDAIRMYSSGFKNVIALMGTSLTTEQVNLIKKLRVPVILMLDNDKAGENATISVGEILQKNNIETFVTRLSGAKDPDEYIVKNGPESLRELLKHPINFMDYKLNNIKVDFNLNNPIELSNYINKVIDYLKDKDNITKEVVIKKLSETYNLDYEVLKSELKIELQQDTTPKKEVVQLKKDNYKECVKQIFIYMMNDIKYVTIFKNKIGFFKEKIERELYNEILFYCKKYRRINIADFLSFIENYDNLKKLVDNIISDMNFDNLEEDIFMEYIDYIDKYLKKERIKELKEKIKNEMDINKKCKLIDSLTKLKKEV